jgi:multicomponent Na+:H+ antiporter subunit F
MTIRELVLYLAFPLLTIAVILAFVRLVRGPTLPDRVVALDLIATLMIGIIAVYAIAIKEPVFLDLTLVLALLSFLGTIAFARYIERRV